ncbi:MAG: DUF4469 domain-containing protein [Treponematales bacterium]
MSDEIQTIEGVNIIRAIPHRSKLPTVPEGSYTLSHEIVGTVDRAALERLMAESGLTEDAVREGFRFFDLCMKKVVELAVAGYSVDTDWFRAALTLSGVVPAARLGHNAHHGEVTVKVNLIEDKRARELAEASPVFVHDSESSGAPVIHDVRDATGGAADTLTLGGMAAVRGLNLAVRGEQTDAIGVYFTPAGGGAAVRVPPEKCSPNTPSLVQFVTPAALTPGQWTVKVATRFLSGGSKFAAEVREGVYEKPITISAIPL